jgi:hypothetical protein
MKVLKMVRIDQKKGHENVLKTKSNLNPRWNTCDCNLELSQ